MTYDDVKPMPRTFLKVFLCIILFCLAGCLESSFQLSPDSRLPKWFISPESVDRNELLVTMDLYSTFSGGEDVYKLIQKGKMLAIQKYTITTDMQHKMMEVQLKSPPEGSPKGYPKYKVVKINGITDIIELRKMEPFFYMTDDPAIWKELGVDQKQ
jgi:hypothetical protein